MPSTPKKRILPRYKEADPDALPKKGGPKQKVQPADIAPHPTRERLQVAQPTATPTDGQPMAAEERGSYAPPHPPELLADYPELSKRTHGQAQALLLKQEEEIGTLLGHACSMLEGGANNTIVIEALLRAATSTASRMAQAHGTALDNLLAERTRHHRQMQARKAAEVATVELVDALDTPLRMVKPQHDKLRRIRALIDAELDKRGL